MMNKYTEIRHKAGLTPVELADILDVDKRTVRRWELNQHSPNKTNTTKLHGIAHETAPDRRERDIMSKVVSLLGKVLKRGLR